MAALLKTTLLAIVLFSLSSCEILLDVATLLAEDDACCTAYRYDGCEIGTTGCCQDCEDLLTYEDDYYVCNCSD